jgi:hypothetical protein
MRSFVAGGILLMLLHAAMTLTSAKPPPGTVALFSARESRERSSISRLIYFISTSVAAPRLIKGYDAGQLANALKIFPYRNRGGLSICALMS